MEVDYIVSLIGHNMGLWDAKSYRVATRLGQPSAKFKKQKKSLQQ